MLRNHRHARMETSTTRRWFNCSFSEQLLLNNGMMSSGCLDIKLPEVMEQGRMGPKLKMVTLNHIKHKPVRCNASPVIKKFKKHTKLKKTADKDDDEAGNHDTSGAPTPLDPFPPSVSITGGDTATSRLLATWNSLIPTLQVRPLNQRWTTRPWHRSLLYCEMEPSLWPCLATPLRRKRLKQTHGRLLLSLYQRPDNMATQAGLTRRNHIPEIVKKREL